MFHLLYNKTGHPVRPIELQHGNLLTRPSLKAKTI